MSTFRVNTNVVAMNALRNLGVTNMNFSSAVTKLSSGMRINSAADDPAGLIASENFRSQIGGIDQAVRNSQDASNLAKTAEGALDEVGRLLRDARSLAVASSNTGVLSATQLQANQTQLASIASSINRIASTTSFGTKKLLDGSAGVSSTVTANNFISSMSFGGQFAGQAITSNATVTIDITTAATRAATTDANMAIITAADIGAAAGVAVGAARAGSFTINGQSFTASATDTYGQLVQRINESSAQTGVTAQIVNVGANDNRIRLSSTGFGSNSVIDLTDSVGTIRNGAGTSQNAGVDALATVTIDVDGAGGLAAVTAAFTGGRFGSSGLLLQDSTGNSIRLTEAGNSTTAADGAIGQLRAGSTQFQIGANAGETTQFSLGNFSASTLGVGAVTGLSVANLDVTTATGAANALSVIDAAVNQVSRARGEIGSFQRNVIESNMRSLNVARENLSATESSIRDIDVAQEMTNYTKLQILQQSGLSVLAQANSAPQSVLSLLR
ncbi:MAG TPA: flagellin [Fimbriimonadaceae bacterium]|nr:flagellin [Fimbriimonadaceae bacterium]HRJ32452.1 flagellin [Fimbriimonadaceae bacterium]